MKKFIKSLKKRLKEFFCFIKGGKKILVLSDSHGGVFEYIHDNDLLLPNYINAEIIGGATAYGLNNENSTTNSFNKFISTLKKFKKYDTILIQLGEVDCSFILWYKAEKLNKKPEEIISYSLKGYEKLIKELKSFNKKIVITGAILPTLKDNQKAEKSAELRNTINATQIERTNLVLEYNKQLKYLARKYNIFYIDISEKTINKTTGLLDERYVKQEEIDHHQCFKNTSVLWVNELNNIL